MLSNDLGGATLIDEARRAYSTRLVRQRLHQRGFRERVLSAYRDQCAMCRLRHRELLDAAHIKPDTSEGEPLISNGLALCKIHHAAFDIGVLGVRPDNLRVHVRRDILDEVDGPMLRHGLQALEGQEIWTPQKAAHRPDPEFLRWKWDRYLDAG
jgi:putative restriction endonuclease